MSMVHIAPTLLHLKSPFQGYIIIFSSKKEKLPHIHYKVKYISLKTSLMYSSMLGILRLLDIKGNIKFWADNTEN